jgi:hypothetical protein
MMNAAFALPAALSLAVALTTVLGGLPLSANTALASSDEAWGQFGADVSKACVTAAKELIDNGRALTDPYGSEHYGMAIVTGRPKGVKNAKTTVSAICVYDKKTKKAEIGGEIPASQLVVKPGK